MTWSWTKTTAAKWERAWTERLEGNPNASIEKNKGGKTIRITIYCDCEDDALFLKENLGGRVAEIHIQDWVAAQNRCERAPLKIRNSLIITEQNSPQQLEKLQTQYPKRKIITVPAEMAFGTGDHATTSSCLRYLSDFAHTQKGNQWTMTDIGCGTAVLAIAALKLGASHATAFDFDPQAVLVSEQNMDRNHISKDDLDLFVGDVFEWEPQEKQKGNLVIANLFSTILQKAFPRIIPAILPGGTLIISGILATQWEETKAAAESHGLIFDNVIKRGKWVTARASLA